MFVTVDDLFYYHFVFGLFLTYAKICSSVYGDIMNIKTLQEALATLKYSQEKFLQNTDSSVQNIFEDSCVKRFEYTLETAIKLMRKILKDEYIKEEADLTINNIFRLMDSYGFIHSWNNWKEYYKQRNNTAHEYNIEKSRELIKIIPNFIEDCEFLIQKLEDKFQQEPYFRIISEILKCNSDNDCEFFAYGSRVKGSFQKSSDLDILIKGDIEPEILQNIQKQIDESEIPFVVHFSNYETMDSDFFESIKNDLVKL